MTQVIAATGGSDTPIDLHALAASAGIAAEHVIPYGRDVAKIDLPEKSVPGAHGHHLVYSTSADGVATVTAFSEKDLKPSGS